PRARNLAAERLYLDDLGAVVAEHGRSERARESVRQIENSDISERMHSRWSLVVGRGSWSLVVVVCRGRVSWSFLVGRFSSVIGPASPAKDQRRTTKTND